MRFADIAVADGCRYIELNSLHPPAVDDMALPGNGAAVVGGQEERQAHDFLGNEVPLDGLIREYLGAVLGSYPEPALFVRDNRSGKNGVNADVVF